MLTPKESGLGGAKISRRGNRLRRLSLALLTGVACAWTAQRSLGSQQSATWNGATGVGGNGDWGNAVDWGAEVVPNYADGTTYVVNVDGGKAAISAVTVGANYVIDALNISAGDSVNIADSSSLSTVNGGLLLNGTISATASLYYSNIPFDVAGNQAVTGTGSIVLNSSSSAAASLINYSTSGVSLPSTVTVNAATGGSITGIFSSAAAISGSGAGSTLTIGGGFTNTGTVTANAGSWHLQSNHGRGECNAGDA